MDLLAYRSGRHQQCDGHQPGDRHPRPCPCRFLTPAASGSGTLILDDQADISPVTGTITASTLTWGGAEVTYGGLASLTIDAGSGGNTINVQSTSQTTATTLVVGTGDTVTASAGAGPIDVSVPGDFGGSILGSAATFGSVQIDGSLTAAGVVKVGTLGTFTLGGAMAGLLRGFGAGTNANPTIGEVTVGGNFSGTISAVTGAAWGRDP